MVVPPMLKGGRIENRWQPMSLATWCSPSSFSTSFIAEKIGRSGQPVQKPAGRIGTSSRQFLQRLVGIGGGHVRRALPVGQQFRSMAAEERGDAVGHHLGGVFAGHRAAGPCRRSLAPSAGVAEDLRQRLLDVVGLALLDDQDGVLVAAEVDHLVVDQRIGDVEDVERARWYCPRCRRGRGAPARG